MKFVQRYQFSPKAIWWKRNSDKASLGKRTIYVATDTLGFEIVSIPQKFAPVALINGKLSTEDEAEYISLTTTEIITTTDDDRNETDEEVLTTTAVKLNGTYYEYNSETQAMEAQDVENEDVKLITADIQDVIRFEKNTYTRKHKFDCIKETDQQSGSSQPISGLLVGGNYLTIKTHNFQGKAEPQHGDLIQMLGKFWIIEDTSKSFVYTPRERSVLHISLKKLGR